MTPRAPLAAAAALLVAGVPVLAGCRDGDDHRAGPSGSGHSASPSPTSPTSPTASTPAASADVAEVQPGGPGEPSSTVVSVPADRWDHDDVAFVQMMLPHHRQALEMAALAPDRAADPRVLAMAERISAAQGPEILVLAGMLAEQGVDVPLPGEDPARYDHGSHGHAAMEGMQSPADLARLARAEGRDFDVLFLEGMIDHHAGAVAMAAEVRRSGSSTRVAEVALDVEAGQAAEIDRMAELLADL